MTSLTSLAMNDATIEAYARRAFYEALAYDENIHGGDVNRARSAENRLMESLAHLFAEFHRQRNEEISFLRSEVVRLSSLVSTPTPVGWVEFPK